MRCSHRDLGVCPRQANLSMSSTPETKGSHDLPRALPVYPAMPKPKPGVCDLPHCSKSHADTVRSFQKKSHQTGTSCEFNYVIFVVVQREWELLNPPNGILTHSKTDFHFIHLQKMEIQSTRTGKKSSQHEQTSHPQKVQYTHYTTTSLMMETYGNNSLMIPHARQVDDLVPLVVLRVWTQGINH